MSGTALLQLVQLYIILLSSSLAYLCNISVISWLLGGIVYLFPMFILAKFAFLFSGFANRYKIVRAFYFGVFIKWCITFILFVIVFTVFAIEPIIFFLSYIMLTLSHWLWPLFMDVNKLCQKE